MSKAYRAKDCLFHQRKDSVDICTVDDPMMVKVVKECRPLVPMCSRGIAKSTGVPFFKSERLA